MKNYKVFSHVEDEGIIYDENEVNELISEWKNEGGNVLSNNDETILYLAKYNVRYYKIVFVSYTIGYTF